MISLSDVLTLQERRVCLGFARKSGDDIQIEHATLAAEAWLFALRDMIDCELEGLFREPEEWQKPQEVEEVDPQQQELKPDDPLAFWQGVANRVGEPILLLDKACSHVHGTKDSQRYAVIEAIATEFERHNKIARLEPTTNAVLSGNA